MNKIAANIASSYNLLLRDRAYRLALVLSLVILIGALTVNSYISSYVLKKASNPVTDIILDNIPVYDVDGIFIQGAVVFWVAAGLIILVYPKKIPFAVKTIGLFILVRSFFISLTHIAPYPISAPIESSSAFTDFIIGGKDLFFSAHTGLPYLLALLFWDKFVLRLVFIASSLLFGTVTLLGHFHYSIDVLAAFFITYAIYDLAIFLFKKDWRLFHAT